MLRAIYPGSFDPVTLGHLDIIRRSAAIADELIVGILNNKAKTPLFSVGERVKMLEEVTKDFPNVKIIPFEGLLVETLFLTTSLEFSFLSSTTVKEVASFGGDITQFVPEVIVRKIKEKMEERKGV